MIRYRIQVVALLLAVGGSQALAQTSSLDTSFALRDWMVPSLESIRFGVLSVANHPGGDRLTVQSIRLSAERVARSEERIVPLERDTATATALDRAAWVWNTDSLMRHLPLQDALVSYLRRERITKAFVQIPAPHEDPGSSRFTLDMARLQPLIARTRQCGVTVHALEGAPDFIRADRQDVLIRLLEAVMAYNDRVPPDARFQGVHLDVEPYLLPGFGSARRADILSSYIMLLKRVRAALTGTGLTFGADIPCWLDNQDEWNGERNEYIEDKARRPVLDAVLDIVDEIGIMSYRTLAEGENGIIHLASNEVALAGMRGKKVLVAMETESLPDEWLVVFRGEPYRGFPIEGSAPYHVTMRMRGEDAEVWYIPNSELRVGSVEWKESERTEFVSWPVHRLAPVPASGITFGNDRNALDSAEAAVVKAFRGVKGFGGTAVHHWERHKDAGSLE